MSVFSQNPNSDGDRLRLTPVHFLRALALAILFAAMAHGFSSVTNNVVFGVAAAFLFAVLFGVLVHEVIRPTWTRGWMSRIACAGLALFIFGVTVAMSSTPVYLMWFGEPSAVGSYLDARAEALRRVQRIRTQIAEAERALRTWAEHSNRMAQLEASEGGSCPGRAMSLGRRGPIAMWREGERAAAESLVRAFAEDAARLGARYGEVAKRGVAAWADVKAARADLNAFVDEIESFARGSRVTITLKQLEERRRANVPMPDGSNFDCGDEARVASIVQAIAALEQLRALELPKSHAMGVNLDDPRAVAVRSMIRSYKLLTSPLAGGPREVFRDDPLMSRALERDGLVNNETMPFLIVMVIELGIIATFVFGGGRAPFPMDPRHGIREVEAAYTRASGLERKRLGMRLFAMKLLANLFCAHPPAQSPRRNRTRWAREETWPEPYPRPLSTVAEGIGVEREVAAAQWLVPYMVTVLDRHFIVVPNSARPNVFAALQMLEQRGLALPHNTGTQWALVNRPVVRGIDRVARMVRDPTAERWSVYEIPKDFAYAVLDRGLRVGQSGNPAMGAPSAG